MKLYYRYAGIGDALFVNTFAYLKGEETGEKILIGTNHPSIFLHNPHVKILPFKSRKWLERYIRIFSFFGKKIEPLYLDYGNPGQKHIFDILTSKTGISAKPTKPSIFITAQEEGKKIFNKKGKKVIAIQSTGVSGWTDNKNYYLDRYQQIVDELGKEFDFIQLGQKTDPLLAGVEDFRDSLSLRDVFILMKEIDLFVGQVGFLMHAAAAVDCPSVIIYGGFEAPWQSGYENNTNIYSAVACAPCWKELCPYNKKCMDIITADVVENAIKAKIEVSYSSSS